MSYIENPNEIIGGLSAETVEKINNPPLLLVYYLGDGDGVELKTTVIY